MSTLIIFAHPGNEGHNSAILTEVLSFLDKKGEKYEVLDLYKQNFDPILKKEELYTSGERNISKEVLEIQEKIKNNLRLIFIYPVWWATMPAILKGFFDRVFTSKVAFVYEKGLPKGLLKNKAAVFITSGAHNVLSSIFQGGRPAKVISKDILGFCGIQSKVFQLGNANEDKLESNKKKISSLVKKGLEYLYS
jgi:NAD(P)H dehydrogenase (quinone)